MERWRMDVHRNTFTCWHVSGTNWKEQIAAVIHFKDTSSDFQI
jgi:hypothetical protein